jgi:hypothetical protein
LGKQGDWNFVQRFGDMEQGDERPVPSTTGSLGSRRNSGDLDAAPRPRWRRPSAASAAAEETRPPPRRRSTYPPPEEDDEEEEELEQDDSVEDDEYNEDFERDFDEYKAWLKKRRNKRKGKGRGKGDGSSSSEDGRSNVGPPTTWDGKNPSFEDYEIKARLWLATTKTKAKARGPQLLKALTGEPFDDFKHLIKDDDWMGHKKNGSFLIDMMATDEFYGEEQEEELIAALSRLTYHTKKKQSETQKGFFTRWDGVMRKVEKHKIKLPDVYVGFLLLNALSIDDQETKMILNYTRGSMATKEIKKAVRKINMKVDARKVGLDVKAQAAKTVFLAEKMTPDLHDDNDEDGEQELLLAALQELDDEEPPAEIDDDDIFEESEAKELLLAMAKDSGKRTFSQTLKAKKNKFLARGFGAGRDGSSSASSGGPVKPGVYKVSIEELKNNRTLAQGMPNQGRQTEGAVLHGQDHRRR